ncbi:MAG: synthase - Glutamine amidotransferase domain-like protein [Actinomycetia bacterium]|nr:synthase - Glutamine amidotransferase domain-like protein [Actinomycetes bacterium]
MRVLAVTHGPDVRPEVFADVIAEDGHELVEWDIRSRGAPAGNDFDAVIVLGGDQNVGEELEHPWLNEEYDVLRRWVDDGTPLLAICLGAQTLAHAVGGTVRPVGAPLSGFYVSELTAAGEDDPVLGVLPQRFESFNANGYWFEIPPGAVELATGPVPQAYRINGSAWAVQFHPEIRRDQVLKWFVEDETVTRPLNEIADELDEKLPSWQEHGRALCRAFLAAAGR